MVPKPPTRLPLFVYGTLRPGAANFASYLGPCAISSRPATVRGRLFLHDEGYPFLTAGDGTVRGEIIEVTAECWEETIARLDELEEYAPDDEAGSLYLRRRVVAQTADGTRVSAWTYLWNRPEETGRRLPDGDWLHRPVTT